MAQKNFADAMNQIVNGTNGLKSQINTKADKHSPNFTGTPTAVTADNETDSTQLATTGFCQNLIRRLVGSAPETLNTLVELATAINNDPTFAQTIVQALDDKLNKTDAANTYLGKNATAASASKVIGGTITLSGSVTGSGSFNSAGNVNITTSGGGGDYINASGTTKTTGGFIYKFQDYSYMMHDVSGKISQICFDNDGGIYIQAHGGVKIAGDFYVNNTKIG